MPCRLPVGDTAGCQPALRLGIADWGGFGDVRDRSKSRIVNWKPAILRLWKRREAKLALLGLVVVAITQWAYTQLNSEGITLEFVEVITNGRGMEAGTLVKFRLRNKSGGEITYFGKNAQEPRGKVESLRKRGLAESGYSSGWDKFTVQDGEEVVMYARVWTANGPWRMKLGYQMADRERWFERIQQQFLGWFSDQRVLQLRPMYTDEVRYMEVASETVDIKVRGLSIKQRAVLESYRRLLNLSVTNRMKTTVVTNADGSFELKQVRITRNTTAP